jgi:response regulator RpfG family c-di-GMP phosphodiesterase
MALEHFKMNINNYVILLSDLRMPGLNGLELIRRVKSLKPSTRTLLMTAFDVDRDNIFQKYLADNTINRFIQKPITLKDLCSEVTNQIRLLSDRKEKTNYTI